MNLEELKQYILDRNNKLTIEEYIYITEYIELLKTVRYIGGDNTFEIVTNDNNCYKIYINKKN